MQQTHYDTLKVSRDAPIEVIRAAYRVLSQKYHPDRHPADTAAADNMRLLNQAYEVLSDPERRHAHDAWIGRIEAESSHVRASKVRASRAARVGPEQEIGGESPPEPGMAFHLRRYGIFYGGVLLALGLVVVLQVAHRPQMNGWVAATPAPEDREAFIRQKAREFTLRQGDGTNGTAAVPNPGTAASPSDNPAPSEKERETPVGSAELRSNDDASRPNDTAPTAPNPREKARSAAESPSGSQPDESVLRSVDRHNDEAAEPGTSFAKSSNWEAVSGTR